MTPRSHAFFFGGTGDTDAFPRGSARYCGTSAAVVRGLADSGGAKER